MYVVDRGSMQGAEEGEWGFPVGNLADAEAGTPPPSLHQQSNKTRPPATIVMTIPS